jgi:hypothetical protein
MRKIIVDNSCQVCGHQESHTILICDTCGKQLGQKGHVIKELGSPFPLAITIGGTNYDFCDYKCILEFINGECAKEK